MSLGPSEVADFYRRKAATRPAADPGYPPVARRIVLAMEALLTADEWGVYRQHVTVKLQEAEASWEAARTALVDATGEALIRLKGEAKYAQGLLEAYRFCLDLPATLQTMHAAGAAETP